MKEKYAVIDLGTNTFHLLIAEENDSGGFNELYRKSVFVNLAEEGIDRIGEAALTRGFEAMTLFKGAIKEFQFSAVKAFGTAALRTASNGGDFIKMVFSETGIEVQLIPGDREAALIYKGVAQAVDVKGTVLIMDIGGGSVEFIIANDTGVQWAKSFPIGVAILFYNFHKSDPITSEQIANLSDYLKSELSPLLEILNDYSPSVLIGASGTFDVLEDCLCKEKISDIHGIVKSDDFYPFYKSVVYSTLQERFNMPKIPNNRAKLIVVALLLIDFILHHSKVETISVSAYAMKEGMLKEMVDT